MLPNLRLRAKDQGPQGIPSLVVPSPWRLHHFIDFESSNLDFPSLNWELS